MTTDALESFISAVVSHLRSNGQAVTQFVSASVDDDVGGIPDIVFSPDDPDGRLVCVEFRAVNAPTLSGMHVRSILKHRDAIIKANPGILYAVATNGALTETNKNIVGGSTLTILPTDWNDPASLASSIKKLSVEEAGQQVDGGQQAAITTFTSLKMLVAELKRAHPGATVVVLPQWAEYLIEASTELGSLQSVVVVGGARKLPSLLGLTIEWDESASQVSVR